jgi:hypothetical protein
MTKNIAIFNVFFVLLFSMIFSYSLTFSFNENININFKLSDNIYPDSKDLKNTKLAFESDIDISKFSIK